MLIEQTILIPRDDDLRPISVREFRASIWMVAAAALAYVLIMLLFVP
ncbi:MAG: hypothetical protein MUE68_10825 [Bacteroidetes bacterium]|jgi:hypothetical protein|nr:hypothetical protein [Bacteroidota bacterium]